MLRDFSLRDFGASLNTVESHTNESSQGKIGLYETVNKQKCTHLGMFLASDISHLSEQIDIHTGNGNIHVTTVDKSKWNGYDAEINQNKSDISALYEITSSGETVDGASSYSLTNAVDYPLVGLNMYGKSVQDGTPTPDNPVEIVSVGDGGTVNITSNNGGDISVSAAITSALPLCGIPVKSGGNYTDSSGKQWVCDELVYNADGTGKIIKNTAKLVLDGSDDENWKLSATINSDTNKRFSFTAPKVLKPVYNANKYSATSDSICICDKYISVSAYKTWTRNIGISIEHFSEGYIIIYDNNCATLTLEDWKTHLAENPVTLIYQLNIPQEIPLTAAEMSALRQLQTYSGITNISNDGGADMDVYYCTNKTLSEYVMPITTGLQAQIDELKSAVLSLGGNV